MSQRIMRIVAFVFAIGFMNISRLETVSSLSVAIDIADPVAVAHDGTHIALVKVDAIDGITDHDEATGEATLPYKYGRMTILHGLKGDLTAGAQVQFYQPLVCCSADVQPGQTYLVYLKARASCAQLDSYGLIGFQGGLRTARIPSNRTLFGVKVLNNFTGKWENLSKILVASRHEI